MKTRALLVLPALALLAACGSSHAGHSTAIPAPTSQTPTRSTSTFVAPSPIAASSSADDDSITCASMVGQPTSSAVDIAKSSATSVTLQCITGNTLATDQTQSAVVHCDVTNDTSPLVYVWFSKDTTAADQNIYAAKVGGTVVVVPPFLNMRPPPNFNILQAVGCLPGVPTTGVTTASAVNQAVASPCAAFTTFLTDMESAPPSQDVAKLQKDAAAVATASQGTKFAADAAALLSYVSRSDFAQQGNINGTSVQALIDACP